MSDFSRLPAHRFTCEKYCGVNGFAPTEAWDFVRHRVRPGFRVLGWCDARRLAVRPREFGLAVMLYEEPRRAKGSLAMVGGAEFWSVAEGI